MTRIDEHGRPGPPSAADEATTLRGFLDFHRSTLDWKTRGLDEAGLRATVGTSTMTLGGLLKHLAWVEQYWFGYVLRGIHPTPPWDSADWKGDPDWDWHSADADSAEELRSLWAKEVVDSREHTEQALAGGGLDTRAHKDWGDNTPNLRWILVHMIEEYARHNGHADLLRESVDGLTGE